MGARNSWYCSRTKIFSLFILLYCFLHGEAQHSNVLVGDYFPTKTYYPNEPSIALNPKNTDQMIVTTNGPVKNYYYSEDGGVSWIRTGNYSFDLGRWGDPSVIADTSGNFYFFHLERASSPTGLLMPDRVFCRMISCDQLSGGWVDSSFTGLNPPKMQDKEWAAYDLVNQNLYVVWSEFDVYGSSNPIHFSNILFSRSTDGGSTWSQPLRINQVSGDCLDGNNSVMGAMPATGPNGEIYVSWPGPQGILFDRSTDQGQSWLAQDIIVAPNPAGDHYYVPGIYRGGSVPVIACDLSNGPNRGTVYINWSDQINGPDDTDIWLSKSLDGGLNWETPTRINDDLPGKHQMFHWLTVDSTNGYLYCVFYDRRNYPDNQTDVFLAVSKNGGESFLNYQISESPFTPTMGVFMGDYSNIVAQGEIIRPVWARMDNGRVSVWSAIIDPNSLTSLRDSGDIPVPSEFGISAVYPNPFNASTEIHYQTSLNGWVEIKIYDITGRETERLFVGYKRSGEYSLRWNAEKYASGVYVISLRLENRITSEKVMLLK